MSSVVYVVSVAYSENKGKFSVIPDHQYYVVSHAFCVPKHTIDQVSVDVKSFYTVYARTSEGYCGSRSQHKINKAFG